jgi:hypothetical protein
VAQVAKRAPMLNPIVVVIEGSFLSHSALLYAVGPVGYGAED